MTQEPCLLCGQMRGGREANLLSPLLRDAWSARPVLLENAAAAVMPSIGALVPGHVLVCPREHVRSFAAAPTESEAELADLATDTVRILERGLEEPVHGFEHGSGLDECRVACSVEHAHLHLLPAEVSIEAELRPVGKWTAIGDGLGELRDVVGRTEYLLYRRPDGQRHVCVAPAGGFPSQLLRRIFADALGVGEHWNWRDFPQVPNIRETVQIFSASVAKRPFEPVAL